MKAQGIKLSMELVEVVSKPHVTAPSTAALDTSAKRLWRHSPGLLRELADAAADADAELTKYVAPSR